MTVTLTASNGAEVVVWREGDTYFARRADGASEPQICLAVDLFEVIAELSALDLERQDQAAEALALAEAAQRRTSLREAPIIEQEPAEASESVAPEDRRDAS